MTAREDPTELDRLDPPPQPPRRASRRKGPVETATARDLATLPDSERRGALGATVLLLARRMDESADMPARDVAAIAAQLRQCLVQIREWAPGQAQGDTTDEARDRREVRLLRPAG